MKYLDNYPFSTLSNYQGSLLRWDVKAKGVWETFPYPLVCGDLILRGLALESNLNATVTAG